jgi:hypothetical protein
MSRVRLCWEIFRLLLWVFILLVAMPGVLSELIHRSYFFCLGVVGGFNYLVSYQIPKWDDV